MNENGVNTAYTPDNINRYTTVGTDAVGSGPEHQIGAFQTNAYQYVGDTFLATINGPASYTLGYDALGRCVKRTLNDTTYYICDGEKAILEYTSTGAIAGQNIYGKNIDEILMRIDFSTGPARTYYYQDDHEGSVTHLTDASGVVVESYRYDAFGAPTINGGARTDSAFNNRFMFTGREYAATFGIYEYRNRAYRPGLGRFMSEDPKGFDAGDYNLFRYVKNDPEDLVDPMGLDLEPQGNADEIARWNQAYKAWSASPTMKPLLVAIAQSKVRVVVHLNKSNDDNLKSDGLHFDPYRGGELKEGGVNSPGVRGAHEVVHVADQIADPKKYEANRQKTDRTSLEGVHQATMSNPNEDHAVEMEKKYARERGEPARPKYERYKSYPITRGVNSNVPQDGGSDSKRPKRKDPVPPKAP